jgi:hypothetical protein
MKFLYFPLFGAKGCKGRDSGAKEVVLRVAKKPLLSSCQVSTFG